MTNRETTDPDAPDHDGTAIRRADHCRSTVAPHCGLRPMTVGRSVQRLSGLGDHVQRSHRIHGEGLIGVDESVQRLPLDRTVRANPAAPDPPRRAGWVSCAR